MEATILSDAEIKAFLNAIPRDTPTGLRNRAFIVVLWRSQLRLAETLDLLPPDINIEEGLIRVRHGKGDKFRIVSGDEKEFAVIDEWLFERRQLGGRDDQPVFCKIKGRGEAGHFGDRLTSQSMQMWMKRIAKKAKINQRVHPHGWRHQGAFEMAKEGIPIVTISKQLGHTDIKTTQIYINHLRPADLVEAMGKRKW